MENNAFEQHPFEATGRKATAAYGTTTPEEQEQLGVLQAKMDYSWAERLQRVTRFGHNVANIPIHPFALPGSAVRAVTAPLLPRVGLRSDTAAVGNRVQWAMNPSFVR